MNHDAQLKLQSYLDGELSGGDIRQVEQWLAQDQDARLLLEELKSTSAALKVFEAEIKLPESREFFWSKIEREIERQEARAPEPEPAPFWSAWRKFLVPAGATAAIMVALFATLTSSPHSAGMQRESRVSDPGAFTYRDFETGTTLVWFSYPAENELAQNEPVGRVR